MNYPEKTWEKGKIQSPLLMIGLYVEIELPEDHEEVTGHQGSDTVDITGKYNRVHTSGGDDVITITGDNNKVSGDGGADTYIVDLAVTDNTVINEVDNVNPDRIVMLNANSSDILFSYDDINGSMEFINAAGNMLTVKGWDNNVSTTGCVVVFKDRELSQDEITDIAINTKKIYEVTGEGKYSVPGNYTGVAFAGYGWIVTIPRYRQSIEYDLSNYSNYITRYVINGVGDETARIEVLAAEDRSLIGTIILERAYDWDDYESYVGNIKTNVKQGEGITYDFIPFTTMNADHPDREYLAANGVTNY